MLNLFRILSVLLVSVLCLHSLRAEDAPVKAENRAPVEASPVSKAEDAPAKTPAESVESDPVGAAGTLVQAVKGGQWRLVASLVLAFLMMALAKLRSKIKWFEGDRGGAVLVGVLALAGAFSTALAADAKIDFKLFLGALGVMWTAVGGYSWFKRILWPQDAKSGDKKTEVANG